MQVQRKENESFEVLLRRFFKEIQQSGLLSEAKRRRFREKEISRVKLRASAIKKALRRRAKRGW